MDKTAIKNFATWARIKLKNDIRIRAGFMGITEKGIAQPLPASTADIQYFDVLSSEPVKIQGIEIQMRKRIVARLEQHAKESGYQTAYDSLIENMASEWFNRLIAIRYMEVNEYFSDQMRVLSSVSEGKQDPDIVSRPFDSDLEFSEAERVQINEWMDRSEADKLFRFLLLKKCNQLAECLPGLFEEKNDASEFFLYLSFIEKDGLIYHLVHDIPEDVWKDQVQIIGWMYQYYNSDFKDETFAALKKTKSKVKKEQIAPVTQLFTPDWIVRYMVENSLGRLWLEGHPDENLKANWKYYLDEAEQEPEVQAKLDEIREEYKVLTPEDLTFIDPCSGSGHILVYAFDILVQIYESQGYTKREAARLILEKNLYGIDIDERAYQLTYFALMMKAREYNRRILDSGIRPNVYCIEESNAISRKQLDFFGNHLGSSEREVAAKQMVELLDIFKDAKEYGSILNVPKMDFDLLREFISHSDKGQMTMDMYGDDTFDLENVEKLIKKLIRQGEALSKKYWVACTNPPYMAISSANAKLTDYAKSYYPNSKTDLFAIFFEKCDQMTRKYGFKSMITQHAWMFLSSYEKLRTSFSKEKVLINMAHLGARAFEEIAGEVVQTTSFVSLNAICKDYIGKYIRLADENVPSEKETKFLRQDSIYTIKQSVYAEIPGRPFAYWTSPAIINAFQKGKKIGDIVDVKRGMTTSDNNRFVRLWQEVNWDRIGFDISDAQHAIESKKTWFPYSKGGGYRKWYGFQECVVDWYDDGKRIIDFAKTINKSYTRTIVNIPYYFKPSVGFSYITMGPFSMRWISKGFIYDSGGPGMFSDNEEFRYEIIGFMNSKPAQIILKLLSPTINLQIADIVRVPYLNSTGSTEKITSLSKDCIQNSKCDWNSYESSWDFDKHPLISVIAKNRLLFDDISNIDLAECYMLWKQECEGRFLQLKSNEEELNRIFIDIYGLQDELTTDVADKDITVHRIYDTKDDVPEYMQGSSYVRTMRDEVVSLLSYAVGCMFGRYSLDTEGLAFAGGEWNPSKYSRFMPDEDNVIPITDQKYMDDDIVERLCEFLKVVYGEKSLETNLDFIANALGGKGSTSRDVIRNYFLNEFFKDHCKTYQKRPIYWLFDSGKQNGFKALVYMHRWDKNSIGRVLVYLHKIQEKYEIEVRAIDTLIEHMTDKRQEATEERRKDHLLKQITEIKDYDERLDHMTNEYIDIDLDDGVKTNYEKVQTDRTGTKYQILAPIK